MHLKTSTVAIFLTKMWWEMKFETASEHEKDKLLWLHFHMHDMIGKKKNYKPKTKAVISSQSRL